MDNSPAALVIAYHTLSGARHGQDAVNSLLARADAARLAGLQVIGACADDLPLNVDPFWLRHKLAHQHVRIDTVEWISLDEPRNPDYEQQILRCATTLGAKRINVGVCAAGEQDIHSLARRLRELAGRAADAGLKVLVEPVVFGWLSTIDQVQDLVGMVRRPNVGTLIDVYHLARAQWADVSTIDPDLVGAIQVCGVDKLAVAPSYPAGLFHDSQCHRRLPHEGDFPLAMWLYELRTMMGISAPLEIEIISDQMRAMAVYEAARAVADSARSAGFLAAAA